MAHNITPYYDILGCRERIFDRGQCRSLENDSSSEQLVSPTAEIAAVSKDSKSNRQDNNWHAHKQFAGCDVAHEEASKSQAEVKTMPTVMKSMGSLTSIGGHLTATPGSENAAPQQQNLRQRT